MCVYIWIARQSLFVPCAKAPELRTRSCKLGPWPIPLAGLDAQPEKNILVADTPGRFAAQVVRLLKDPSLRKGLGQRGMETVRHAYSWQQQAKLLEIAMEAN